jgi:hypothetical protein
MDKPKIMLCPLVTDDYPRAERAIRSAFTQTNHNLDFGVHVVINSQNQIFIHKIKNFCGYKNIPFTITESDGSAATGKNSVFDVFLNSDYTHLSQLDGDDLFYPTFLTQTERHLTKYPLTDVLATLPVDVLLSNYEEGDRKLDKGFFAKLWGTHYAGPRGWNDYFGRDKLVDGISIPNYARFVLFSRKIAEMGFKYDKNFLVGEDKKLHFDFLYYHQLYKISYWFTMASDMWICDRMSYGVQKKHYDHLLKVEGVVGDDTETTERLRQYVMNLLCPDRSAPGEIPTDYPPIYLDYEEKVNFLNKFL